MKMRLGMALAFLLLATQAHAGAGKEIAEARQSIESTMLVTGMIDIREDGSVAGHELDQPDKLPPVVVDLVEQTVSGFRFEPNVRDGKAAHARSRMGVRVVAKKVDDDHMSLRISNASFWNNENEMGAKHVSKKIERRFVPPKYPSQAVNAGFSGTVYLAIKVNAQGGVDEVVPQQVNLKFVGSQREMEWARKLLADASVKAVRKWHFKPPTSEDMAGRDYIVLSLPIAFNLRSQRQPGNSAPYGQWEAYVPGPIQRPDWMYGDLEQKPDAMIANIQYQAGRGPKLLTPLGDS